MTYEAIQRIRAVHPEWSSERLLTAVGHPGFGPRFADDVVAMMSASDCDARYAIDTVLARRSRRVAVGLSASE